MASFAGKYAGYYDLLYIDKDYQAECRFIEEVFRKYSGTPVRDVLDAGCGTGGHGSLLARDGYRVTGIDGSQDMLEVARRKALATGASMSVQHADLRKFDLGRTFDACACMFNVFGYITMNADVEATLGNFRRHLAKGGLLLMDFWNGLAVLRSLPNVSVKKVEQAPRKLIRIGQPRLDAYNHVCHIDYHIVETNGKGLVSEMDETHTVRYFFPQELIHYLEHAGFQVLKLSPFLRLDGEVNENVWNVTLVASAE